VIFFTPDDFSQQLAYMNHSAGHEIVPHEHNPVSREVNLTQEVLVVRKGKLRVDFYDDERRFMALNIFQNIIINGYVVARWEMLQLSVFMPIK
jgi:hypothetical protein